jgi:SSS family solute:Na+ symporter
LSSLHYLDYIAMTVYFVVVLWIGISVARSKNQKSEYDSFLAADRNMNLVQTTSSAAATDIGGGFSIAMGGLGFTCCIRFEYRHGIVFDGSKSKTMV